MNHSFPFMAKMSLTRIKTVIVFLHVVYPLCGMSSWFLEMLHLALFTLESIITKLNLVQLVMRLQDASVCPSVRLVVLWRGGGCSTLRSIRPISTKSGSSIPWSKIKIPDVFQHSTSTFKVPVRPQLLSHVFYMACDIINTGSGSSRAVQ